MTFTVTYADHGGVGPARLRLAGELDMGSAPQLNAVIDRLAEDGERRLLIDLTDLTFCDSTGIAVFVRGDNRAAAEGGWLRVTGATGRVERVLQLTGLAEVLGYGSGGMDPAGTDRPGMG
ncbi:anti-anti-sigma factor [Micromonospora phaseoli]|uniref:Anti-sigma factor antagonist n=1 Tax=Micromonospora phaseoli TaxID=1144548 RepID=A0A1H6YPH1_9ACTN|nr:STAS domain-containing protein [Micromonospora phaseoli]PZW00319.1 anti-anti-sigma factor [Micromonospora phaseoli]GIJ76796.1 anti-sigma factor antagonist [Micromonospora phaseoli]SEJ43218.1 anti-anti-sigma factor [Micromonospora phaseoli]